MQPCYCTECPLKYRAMPDLDLAETEQAVCQHVIIFARKPALTRNFLLPLRNLHSGPSAACERLLRTAVLALAVRLPYKPLGLRLRSATSLHQYAVPGASHQPTNAAPFARGYAALPPLLEPSGIRRQPCPYSAMKYQCTQKIHRGS